jgi:PIN domain nuclease of toxin-antitoxin system
MGEGLGRSLSLYLDTHVVAWLGSGQSKKIARPALRVIDSSELAISPMVLVELEYLYEVRRLAKPALAIVEQVERQLGLAISDHPFSAVAKAALYEAWTRDAFDRIIVAQARSDGYSGLVSADEKIKHHYSMTIWD